MNGYAKIRVANNTTKSRSIDFSDLISFPQIPKPTTNTSPNPTSKAQETKKITTTTTTNDLFSDQEDHHEEEANGKSFGEVLKRNSSVSSSSITNSAVKWAFSMKRSSSVSERYCRIHDQSVTLAPLSNSPPSFIDDDEVKMDKMQTRSVKKKHKRSKILKACKRLFGL